HILACQRHMRILGILVKRWVDLQLPVTQDYFVRVWRLLYSHRAEPALAPVYAWLDAHIPASCRDDWTP
ncbi:MAG: aminoglycoside phosphotransferase, partial [Alphaproteobacteria bacterium]|nr:aminoglycoside phosphotransferase [Alphaproteobacteria bacterium]